MVEKLHEAIGDFAQDGKRQTKRDFEDIKQGDEKSECAQKREKEERNRTGESCDAGRKGESETARKRDRQYRGSGAVP